MPVPATRSPAPTVVSDDVDLPPRFPDLPDDVLERFPSLENWRQDTAGWWRRTYDAIQGSNRFVSQSVTKANSTSGDLRISINGNTAAIETETEARITADEVLARRIVTVSAIAGVSQSIKIQGTPPAAPALNDYWINNTDLLNPVTYKWDGAQWNEVTTPISVAAVAAEQTARISADGFLSGKYTLTVAAGNVVTGMNITSSSGGGTDISSVIFRATDFQIYNGSTGKTMFVVSGSDVRLANVLTVSTAGRVYIGSGSYASALTPFYVDSSGNFSLGANLTWDGATLTITGSISATTGTIGGWNVSTTTLSKNNATLDSAGQLILGTSNDVVYLSATDATYRIWIGNTAAASAAFSVTKAGAMKSTSGTIASWTIGTTSITSSNVTLDSLGQLYLGTSNDIVYLSAADATYRLWIGNVTAGSATFRVTKAGVLTATGATITGSITATTGAIGGWTIAATTLSNNNAILDSSGQLVLGTSNDIVYLSATDATYRLWIGNVTAASATFRVTKAGAVTATSGTIGGWTLSSTRFTGGNAFLDSSGYMVLGTSNDVVYISAVDSTYRLWVGNATAASASFSVTKTGVMTATGATITGAVTFATTGKIVATDNASYLTWQGNAGLNIPGVFLQHEAGASGGVNILGVGTASSSGIFLTKARGSFGALSAVSTDDVIGVVGYQLYTGAAWTSVMISRVGITNSTATPFYFINVGGVGADNQYWVFNYDGKLYFDAPNSGGPANAYGGPTYVSDPLCNLYRLSSGLLKTDGQFAVASLTSGRVTFATTSGLLTDASTLTFNSGTGALSIGGACTAKGAVSSAADGSSGNFGQIFASTTVAAAIGQILPSNSSGDVASLEAIGSSITRYGETGRSTALYMEGVTNSARIIFSGASTSFRIGSSLGSWTELMKFGSENTVGGSLYVRYSTDATTGGNGALVVTGGVYAGGQIISATTFTSAGGVTSDITSVNAVSPTSPNRTVTIKLNGTTYYLAAKTTND